MMKSVLLVGELNEVLRNINFCLKSDFNVQVCIDQKEIIKGTIRIVNPDLIIYCKLSVDSLKEHEIKLLKEKSKKIPVLIVTTNSIWSTWKENYEKDKFEPLFRPIKRNELIKKCYEIMGIDLDGSESKRIKNEKIKGKTDDAAEKDNVKYKIMVVDDSPLVVRNIKGMLEENYEVCVATSGEMALEHIPRKKPDLILLDYEMPGLNGKDTFERILSDESMKNIPVVFLTSVAEKRSILDVLVNQPAGYVLKPAKKERLIEVIKETLK